MIKCTQRCENITQRRNKLRDKITRGCKQVSEKTKLPEGVKKKKKLIKYDFE